MYNEYFLQIIGSGDAFHNGAKLHTSFYYHTPRHNFLIDCGATTLLGLKKQNISTNDIDTIIISHFHGDHFGGLPFLLLEMSKLEQRKKPLQIVTPKSEHNKIKQLFTLLYPGAQDTLDKMDIKYLNFEKQLPLGDFIIESFEVNHASNLPCYGFAILDDKKKLAFTGDTEWCENIIPLSKDANLFLCECNFYDQNIKGHLNYVQIKENIHVIRSAKILLTHAGISMLERKNIDLEIANDGNIYFI